MFNAVGPLELSGGSGVFTVDTAGHVTMTFSSQIEGGFPVYDGKLRFWSEIRTDLTGESTNREVKFPVVDQSTFVNLQPKNGTAIAKNIDSSAIGYNEQTLYWWIDINTSLARIDATRIVDSLPTGVETGPIVD